MKTEDEINANNIEYIEEVEKLAKEQRLNHMIFFGYGDEIYHAVLQENEPTKRDAEMYKNEILNDETLNITENIIKNTWCVYK